MGRHSAPSRIGRRLKRTAANVAAVLLVTSIATTVIFVGIALYAVAEDNEIPPPTITAGTYDAAPATGFAPGTGHATEGRLRRCPATGCAASTCHAETGEPPPGR